MTAIFGSIWTVVALLLFVGIAAWAWSGRRKADFEEAARLALDDDDDQPGVKPSDDSSEDKKNV